MMPDPAAARPGTAPSLTAPNTPRGGAPASAVPRGRVFVVTGGGAGLGAAVVQSLAGAPGTTAVFALDLRFPSGRPPGGVVTQLVCDVTSDDSVTAAVEAVAATLPDRRSDGVASAESGVDAVVHCAGVYFGGPLSEMEAREFAATLEVNVVGIVRVHRGFFELLRRAAGTTVLISSEVGLARAVSAFTAPYAVSKVAVEGVAVALRQELAMLTPPMPVVVINPGACGTAMLAKSIDAGFTKHIEAGSVWTEPLRRGRALAVQYMERNTGPVQWVADAVVAAVRSPTRRERIVVNRSWTMLLLGWLPQWVLDVGMRWSVGTV